MPDTPDSLTMRALAKNALRGTIVGTHHGAVIGRMPHAPDSLTLNTLPKNSCV